MPPDLRGSLLLRCSFRKLVSIYPRSTCEFGNVGFWGEGKPECLEKPFEIKAWTNSKLNSHTVNSLYCDLYSVLELVSSLVRVCFAGDLTHIIRVSLIVGCPVFLPDRGIAAWLHFFGKCHTLLGPIKGAKNVQNVCYHGYWFVYTCVHFLII